MRVPYATAEKNTRKTFASTWFLTFSRGDALLFVIISRIEETSHRDSNTYCYYMIFTRSQKRERIRNYFGDDALNLGQHQGTSSPGNRRSRPSWRVYHFHCKQKTHVARALKSREFTKLPKIQKVSLHLTYTTQHWIYIFRFYNFIWIILVFESFVCSCNGIARIKFFLNLQYYDLVAVRCMNSKKREGILISATGGARVKCKNWERRGGGEREGTRVRRIKKAALAPSPTAIVIVFSVPTAPWQRPGRKRASGWREIKGFSRQVSRD